MPIEQGGFVWHELMTRDAAAAARFYAEVLGWRMTDSGLPGQAYTIANVGERPVAGMMTITPEMAGLKPVWRGYVLVADVDAKATEAAAKGGTVHFGPADIPEVGRFAVVSDPTGSVVTLFRPDGSAPPDLAPGTPGTVGWNELRTGDWPAAFAFFEALFGWEKAQAVDMGPAGTYQTFTAGGVWAGGMMNGEGGPSWLTYFAVEDVDAGAARIREAGGTVGSGPHQVPGGGWIVHATDPQAVPFALVGPRAAGG